MRILLPLFLLGCTMFAADLTGKWTGTVDIKAPDGNSESGPAVLTLKQTGDAITGTVGQSEDDVLPIEKAKFDGKKLTFEVHTPSGMTVRLALDLVEPNKLDGTAEVERDSGEKAGGKIVLQRT